MLGSALIIFRETLEAALLIGLVAAASRSVAGRSRWIVGGIIAGALGAVVVALSASRIALLFEGIGQELFNASVLAIAIAMLAWHQIWMSTHSKETVLGARQVVGEVREGRQALSALFVVIALAVLREGAESVLFLYGLFSGGDTALSALVLGGAVGLLAGAVLGAVLYAGMLRIPLRWFFAVTSAFILLLAAGMAAKLAQLLVQADLIPPPGNPVWDTSAAIPAESAAGVFLHALIGYEPRPAPIQVLAYAGTVVFILFAMRLARRSGVPAAR
jgi:high-affinity iron transporter